MILSIRYRGIEKLAWVRWSNHTIRRRVVRSSTDVLYSQHGFQAEEKMRLKLAFLVCGYDSRYSKERYPVRDETFCLGFFRDITERNGHRA
ncbi:hypothetical protein TNCT_659761 [Trichonephila clavata]|uniref:Uncharacterized protein n=1 Tax=Trichonephila clavata TaxID=2740835 RepID=A0A8X6KS71_TRICU|nr:hypothetical protein TNCT_659761 [Trichonephila clavata]